MSDVAKFESERSFLEQYLAPLNGLLDRTDLVELAINPDGRVFTECLGDSHMTAAGISLSAGQQERLARAICGALNIAFSEKQPIVSLAIRARGMDLRAQVVGAPAAIGAPAITLRKYATTSLKIGEVRLLHGTLVDLSQQRRDMAERVRDRITRGAIEEALTICVHERLNVVISGGTSSGKTTFARAMLELVDPNERIVTIEDSAEIRPTHPNVVQLLCERKDGSPRNADLLLQSTLRMRPDRIIVGELRGGEAKTFLEAINTGHGGSFTTLHAETARKAIERLALMVLSTGIAMTWDNVIRYAAQSIDLVIQLGRKDGKRGIAEITIGGEEG